MKPTTMIRVVALQFDDTFTCTWGEFQADNSDDPGVLVDVETALNAGHEWTIGGGADPMYTIALIGPCLRPECGAAGLTGPSPHHGVTCDRRTDE